MKTIKNVLFNMWHLVQEADANIYYVVGILNNLSEDEIISMIYSNEITYVSKFVNNRRKLRIKFNVED